MSDKHKFYLTANINIEEETVDLRKEVASVIKLPSGAEKQPDLSYFSAIFVSSGENLNHAYFLGSELVAAADTIVGKALDIEHKEQDIIGHLYSSAFTDLNGNKLDIVELASKETATLDTQDMHIQIGSIMYKNRFPELAKEIADNEYKVSMECYYTDFDVKVGNTIIPREAAEAVGIATLNDSTYGKFAKLIKDGKEVAAGTIARVLRGICFSGCGIVKNPANPPSVILEVASDNNIEPIILNLDLIKEVANDVSINVTSKDIEVVKENSDTTYNDSVGICINYKKRVEDKAGKVVKENWCSEYSSTCTSFSRDVSDQNCLRSKVKNTAASYVETLFDNERLKDTTNSLNRLQNGLNKAKKLVE